MTTLIPKYDQSSTGAVNRPFNQKLLESVSILDFGADPTGVADSTSAIQAAHNAARRVIYPVGTYKISSSIVLGSGAIIIGQGTGSGGSTTSNSSIVQTTTSAFAYTMSCPANAVWEGPRFFNIQISCQNGVQLNTTAGGSPSTEGTILNASFRKVYIVQNGTTFTGTGIQATFCSKLEITEQCEILGFNYCIDIYESDTVVISHNRIWQFGYTAIRLYASSSYGSDAFIEKNELYWGNTGSLAFILATDYEPTIRDNYIEQASAEGTGMAAAIVCNNNLRITIENNGIIFPSACGPNWLNVGYTSSLQQVSIFNNQLIGTGIGPAIFNAGNGIQPFYNSGSGITVCNHWGNTFENGIPMNTVSRDQLPLTSYKTVSVLTPSLYGSIVNTNYGTSAYINNNVLVIPPSSGGNLVWMRDPNNKLTQTVSVYVLAYASGNQTLQVSTGDNFVGGSLTPISLTTTPKWFQITASVTATTELEIEFVNYTAGGSNTAYIESVVINTP